MTHLPTTKYLKLPLSFDPKALEEDLKGISEEKWLPQIYTINYDGRWTSLALLSSDGDNDTFSSASANDELKETVILQNCPYFKKVLDSFHCPLISARLLRLNAGSYIKPHKDYKLGYENNNFRVHIPIETNDQVEFILDGQQLSMLPGESWYTNVNFTHSVANRGKNDRIHLVLDAERNEWSDELFFSLAPKESFSLLQESQEEKRQIIEELKRMNNPASKRLLQSLE